MKIYIDFSKQAITKIDSDVAYVGDVYSNVFELLFFNYGDNADWFPTMSQLAPNGREAGDFSADALGENETYDYVENDITYKRYTFTIGDGWVRMKGRSNFFIWVNNLVDSNTLQRKCYGKVSVVLNESTDNYFIQDAYFNPKVKEYIDNTIGDDLDSYKSTIDEEVESQNATIASLMQASPSVFDTASNIGNLQENKGVAVATDTGYIYYWDSTLTTPAYVSSGLQYNSLSGYVKHSGNQLQDGNGNNIYPVLNDGQVTLDKIDGNIIKTNNPEYHLIADLTWEDGYINPSGNLVPSTSYSHTEFIEIDEVYSMGVFPPTSYTGLSFYDKNQNPISTVQLGNNPVNVPYNTRYIKVSQVNTSISKTAYIIYSKKFLNPNCLANVDCSSLSQSKIVIASDNIFNKNTCMVGVYVESQGNLNPNADFVASDFIYVKDKTYITTSVGCIVTWFSDTFGYQSLNDSRGNTLISVPSTAYYCRLSFQLSRSSVDDFHANFGNILLPYDTYKIKYMLVDCLPDNFVVVDKNGTGQYKTITEAVYNAVDGTTIFIKSGNYEDEIIKCWGKTIHLIGESRNQVIISNTTGDYAKPPIEMGAGTLKNLTIIAKENSQFTGTHDYAVHVEDNNLANKKLLIENCTIKSEINSSLGMGMRGGCSVELRNSHFESISNSAIFVHDAANSTYAGIQDLLVSDCKLYVTSSWSAVRFDSQEVTETTVNVTMINNLMRILNNPTAQGVNLRNAISNTPASNFSELINWNLTLYSFNNNYTVFNT